MFLQSCMCVLLVGVAVGRPQYEEPAHIPQYAPPPHPDPYHPPHEKEEKKPYAFDYGVKDDYSGSHYGHQEDSDGEAVKGSYTVALPDGRIQTVTYVADHINGFQARVTYEGEATYPDTENGYNADVPSYAPPVPAYNPPAPSYRPSAPAHAPPPPAYPSAKQEVEQQIVYEPVEAADALYRGQVEEFV